MSSTRRIRIGTAGCLLGACLMGSSAALSAQPPAAPPSTPAAPRPPQTGAPFDPAKVPAGLPAPKMWTAQQDHQDMKDQLGIKALRPGPSGNETAPNHANYDEALANPYPKLPEVLTLNNGKPVKNAGEWTRRRKEIIEEFDREVLGRVPQNVPRV